MSSGSDPQLLIDDQEFFDQFDQLDDEEDQRALYRAYRLAHGGQLVTVNGQVELVGGRWPVRPA